MRSLLVESRALTVHEGRAPGHTSPSRRAVCAPRHGPCFLVLSSQRRWEGGGCPDLGFQGGLADTWGSIPAPALGCGMLDELQRLLPTRVGVSPPAGTGGAWVTALPQTRPRGLSPRQITAWAAQQLPVISAEPALWGDPPPAWKRGVCTLNSVGLRDCGTLIIFQNLPFVSRLALAPGSRVCG